MTSGVTTTCPCGASVPDGAGWCSLCHRPVPDARFAAVVDAETVTALVGLPWALRDIWRRADRL